MSSVAFSPDGSKLVVACRYGEVMLWDVATGRPSPLLANLQDSVDSVAFSPDGQTLALGHKDGKVMLWDVSTRQWLGSPLTGHRISVCGMAFSPDGQTLASASGDGRVMFWPMQSGWFQFARKLTVSSPTELIRHARQMANRELTDKEVEEYFGEFTKGYEPLCPSGNSGNSTR